MGEEGKGEGVGSGLGDILSSLSNVPMLNEYHT